MNEKNTYNWPLVGNKHITDWLARIIAEDRVGGTYILNGPDNLGKTTLARTWAQILLCEKKHEPGVLPCGSCPSCRRFAGSSDEEVAHGDFHLLKKDKDKKNISVTQVRELISVLSMSSFLNSYKIGIVKHADTLSAEAANALLKTLEEPRPKVAVLLVTDEAGRLPATIRSRAQILNFRPVATDVIYDYLVDTRQVPRDQARQLARLSLGRPALAVKFLENKDFSDNYIKSVESFLALGVQDLNARFRVLGALVGGKTAQEKAVSAKRLLETWSGVARDLILADYSHFHLIQHDQYQDQLSRMKPYFGSREALRFLRAAGDARRMIDDNVNPLLALENVLVSF